MSHSPTNPERHEAPVEPGFADLPMPVSVGATDDPVGSGVLAMLRGPSGQRQVDGSERLPPGRATRPGEH
jgi:hypothetical protein